MRGDTSASDSDHDELMAELRGDVRVSAKVKYDKGKRKYGDSWLDSDPWYCLDRMEEAFYEFRQAAIHHQDPDAAIEEMADMLNYGLMFAVLAGLYDTEEDEDDGLRTDGGTSESDKDRSITEIAHEYLRAVDEAEAKKEEILAGWAEEYYQPGYLDDHEWERLKRLLDADDTDHALMQIEIACYRKAATELDREDEFDDSWPAKDGVIDS